MRSKATRRKSRSFSKNHPDSEIFLPTGSCKDSLPGAGPILAARILAEIGDNRQRYGDYQALRCEAGTAPLTIASGNYSYVRFGRAWKKSLRATLHQFAFCSRRKSDWANQFYQQQGRKGKSNSLATRALANKWVKVTFALWQKRQLYNGSFHLWDKARYTLQARAAEPRPAVVYNREPNLDIESLPSSLERGCSCRDGLVASSHWSGQAPLHFGSPTVASDAEYSFQMVEVELAQYEHGGHDIGTIVEAVEETNGLGNTSESSTVKAGPSSRVSGRWE